VTIAVPALARAPTLDLERERILIVANPTAGQGRGDEDLQVVESALRAAGVSASVHRTTGPGNAQDVASTAEPEGFGLVVALGGDGTLHEVLNGLCSGAVGERPSPALGLVPVGTGNDYARMLGVPGCDPRQAAEVLLRGATRRVDLGGLTGLAGPSGPREEEWFCNNVGIGFLGVANAAHETHRWLPGRLSYSLGGFIEFVRFKTEVVHLEVDEHRLSPHVFGLQLSIGRYCGGGINLAPDASLADGRLQVCVIHARNKLSTFLLWPRMAAGEKLSNVSILAGERVRVEGKPGFVLHADGEVRRAHADWIEARVKPLALRVVHGRG
jgi:diacylglycerol kinase (ATP)